MFSNTKLAQVMSVNPITVTANNTMDQVNQIFEDHNFHHLPVVDENEKLIGIISKTDLNILCERMSYFRKEDLKSKNDRFFKSLLASDVMHQQVKTLKAEQDVISAANMFSSNLFHAIPIVDKENKIVGIVTTFDLIKYAYTTPVEQS